MPTNAKAIMTEFADHEAVDSEDVLYTLVEFMVEKEFSDESNSVLYDLIDDLQLGGELIEFLQRKGARLEYD